MEDTMFEKTLTLSRDEVLALDAMSAAVVRVGHVVANNGLQGYDVGFDLVLTDCARALSGLWQSVKMRAEDRERKELAAKVGKAVKAVKKQSAEKGV